MRLFIALTSDGARMAYDMLPMVGLALMALGVYYIDKWLKEKD